MKLKKSIFLLLGLVVNQAQGLDVKPPLAPKVFVMSLSSAGQSASFSPLSLPHKSCELCCARKRSSSESSAGSVSPITIISVVSTITPTGN